VSRVPAGRRGVTRCRHEPQRQPSVRPAAPRRPLAERARSRYPGISPVRRARRGCRRAVLPELARAAYTRVSTETPARRRVRASAAWPDLAMRLGIPVKPPAPAGPSRLRNQYGSAQQATSLVSRAEKSGCCCGDVEALWSGNDNRINRLHFSFLPSIQSVPAQSSVATRLPSSEAAT
jgi:hypothetical protein